MQSWPVVLSRSPVPWWFLSGPPSWVHPHPITTPTRSRTRTLPSQQSLTCRWTWVPSQTPAALWPLVEEIDRKLYELMVFVCSSVTITCCCSLLFVVHCCCCLFFILLLALVVVLCSCLLSHCCLLSICLLLLLCCVHTCLLLLSSVLHFVIGSCCRPLSLFVVSLLFVVYLSFVVVVLCTYVRRCGISFRPGRRWRKDWPLTLPPHSPSLLLSLWRRRRLQDLPTPPQCCRHQWAIIDINIIPLRHRWAIIDTPAPLSFLKDVVVASDRANTVQ